MRLKTSLLTLFAALILTAGGAGAATAGVIDTTPSWKLDGSSFTSPTFGNGSSTPSPTNLGDTATYGEVVAKYGLAHDGTWMIGNSPKSDINPALAAGLNAVFVPHDQTWILEHEEVAEAPPGQRLLVVEKFAGLREHF